MLGLPGGQRSCLSVIIANGDALMLDRRRRHSAHSISIGLGGGAARPILDDVCFGCRNGDPDGRVDAAVVRSVGGKFRLEYPAGQRSLRDRQSGRGRRFGCASTLRMASIAFFDYDAEAGDYDVKVVDSSKQVRILTRGWRTIGRLGWSPDGKEVWMSAGRPGENPLLTADRSRRQRSAVMAQLPELHAGAPRPSRPMDRC